jgi:hypothetical protein
MVSSESADVLTAFDAALKAITREIKHVQRAGSQAFDSAEYQRAREALTRVEQLTAYQDKVVALRKEWEALTPVRKADQSAHPVHDSRVGSSRGLLTPRTDYYRPILRALVRLGGSGTASAVVDHVYAVMKPSLSEYDYSSISSNPEYPHWLKSLHWARYDLVKQGLLKRGSPHGIWEISDEGHQFLAKGQS